MGFVGISLSSLLVAGALFGGPGRDVGTSLSPTSQASSEAPERLPANEAALGRLGRDLPGFRRQESERFVLLSDCRDAEGRATLTTLERAAGAVARFAEDLGWAVRPLRERVTVVAFGDRSQFERFAAATDRIDATWMTGYWAPGADRIVLRQGGGESLAAASSRGVYASATTSGGATAAHEAGHQLLHRLGIQRRSPGAPVWISEGLAIGFEPCAAGAERIFAPQPDRTARVRASIEANDAVPLSALVSMVAVPSEGAASVTRFYDQSWSLASWLWRERREDLRVYLALVRERAGNLGARENAAIFERAFGDVAALESAWRRSARE